MFLCATSLIALSSCEKMDDAAQQTDANAKSINDYSRVFPPKALVLGKTREQWMVEYYRWITQFDCQHFPAADSTGALQNQNQPDGVFFLSGKRTAVPLQVTVPSGKRIFFGQPILFAPYPNTSFGTPDSGQTLDEFLYIQMDNFLSNYNNNYILLDSDSINLNGYKTWTGSFQLFPNPDLSNCWYPSNPQGQTIFVGGNFAMLKPLSPGQHTIRRGGYYYGYYLEWNYVINQE